MAKLEETYACVPAAEQGQGILIAGGPRSNDIAYCNGRSVIIRYLDCPLDDTSVYAKHAYPATVARFSPNGEWVASTDVFGSIRIWGHGFTYLRRVHRIAAARTLCTSASPSHPFHATLFPGDGIGPEIAAAVKQIPLS